MLRERRLPDRAQRLDGDDTDYPLTEQRGGCQRHRRTHRVPDEHQLAVGKLPGHGDDVLGIYDSYQDALTAGYEKVGLDPFLVKRISAIESVAYFSRELVA